MRFAIIDGKPYLIGSGKAYPVTFSGSSVTIGKTGRKTDEQGVYTQAEIIAKLGDHCTSVPVRRTRKRDGNV